MNKYLLSYIFLIISLIITIYPYILLFINYLKSKNTINKTITGYDIAKSVLDNNNIENVNIIEVKNTNSNLYNLRRKTIKLSYNTYYNKNDYHLALALHKACYAVIDHNKDSYINILKKFFTNIGFYQVSSIISLIISLLLIGSTENILGLIILIIISIYQYLIKTINNYNYEISIKELNNITNIRTIDKENITNILKSFNNIANISLLITVLQIARSLIFIIL